MSDHRRAGRTADPRICSEVLTPPRWTSRIPPVAGQIKTVIFIVSYDYVPFENIHLPKSLWVNFHIFCLFYQVLHILHLVSYILILELPVLDNENMMYKSGRYYAFRNITVFFINNKWIRNNGSCDVMFVPYLYKVFTSTPTPARCCGRILQYKIICSIKFKQWNIIINRFRTDSIPVLCKPMAF